MELGLEVRKYGTRIRSKEIWRTGLEVMKYGEQD